MNDLPQEPSTRKNSKVKLSPRSKFKPDLDQQASDYLAEEVESVILANGGSGAAAGARQGHGVPAAHVPPKAPGQRRQSRPQAKPIDDELPAAPSSTPSSADRTPEDTPKVDTKVDSATVTAQQHGGPGSASGKPRLTRQPSRGLPFSPKGVGSAYGSAGPAGPSACASDQRQTSSAPPRSPQTTPRGKSAALEGMTLVQLCELRKENMFTDAEFAALKAQLMSEV